MKVRRFFAVLLVMAVMLSISVIASAAGEVYTFGVDGQKVVTQGVNGWYYMYSPLTNQGDNFDTTTFKECIQGLDTWAAWDGVKLWVPNETKDSEGNDIDWMDNKWFRIDNADGCLRPGYVYTAAAKWVSQKDGEYKVVMEIVNSGSGDGSADWAMDDGLTYSIYKDTTRLDSVNTGKTKISKTLEQTVSLKTGEALYFIADFNEQDWDDSTVKITIQSTAAETETPATETPTTETPATETPATETPATKNPKTGDAGLAVSFVALAASALSIAALRRRK